MRKRMIVSVAFILVMALNGCTAKEQEAPMESSQEAEELSPGEVPELTLQDSLSSTYNPFKIKSGNYTWNYEQAGEMKGMVACGCAPLEEAAMDFTAKLELPEYNGTDSVLYSLSAQKDPDTVTVSCWDASDVGNADAKKESVTTYDPEMYIVELEAGKVYEFAAEWKEENLDKNGFYGTATYVLVTE